MRQKLRSLRSKISSKNEYDDDFIEKIKEIPTYDLFTPDRGALICEESEVLEPNKVKFLLEKNQSNSEVVIFVVSLKKQNEEELTPVELHLRYNVDEKELPHYPGKDYKFSVHNTELIESRAELEKLIEGDNIKNYSIENYPVLKIRTRKKKESSHMSISI